MLGAAGARSVKQLLGAKHMALTLEPGAPLAPRGVGQFAACLGVRGASPARARRVIPCLAGVILVEPLEWLQVVP